MALVIRFVFLSEPGNVLISIQETEKRTNKVLTSIIDR